MGSMNAKIMIIIILLISSFPVCFAQSNTVEKKPIYSVGDYWNYKFTTSDTNDTRNMTITDLNATFEGQVCIEEKYSYPFRDYIANRRDYYRVSDMAEMGSITNLSYEKGTSILNQRLVYDPPISTYHFPMNFDDDWSSHTVFHEYDQVPPSKGISHVSIGIDIYYNVITKEKITVAAGTFDAFKVVRYLYNNSTHVYSWYAPKVGNYVKETVSFPKETHELLSYSFKNTPKDRSTTKNGGMLGGNQLYSLIFVIIIVAVIIVVGLIWKKKRKVPTMPPQEPLQQPAPQVYDPAPQKPWSPEDQDYDLKTSSFSLKT